MVRIKKYYISLFFLMSIAQVTIAQLEPSAGKTVDYNTVSMPESPSASTFNSVGNTKVNTATGVPEITIPLYTYELDGVKIPIAISYNAAGIKVSDLATPVGLNWSLIAGGQISRTVRGKTDEREGWLNPSFTYLPDSWYAGYNPNNPYQWQKDMKGTYINDYNGYAKNRDHNPDLFSYSFLGNSGSYIHTPSGTILKERQDGIEISSLIDGGLEIDLDAHDLNGNTYAFFYEDTEQSSNINISSVSGDLTEDFFDWEGENGYNPITAWKLSKITTKNNKEIQFDYQSEDMLYTLSGTSYHISIGYGCAANTPPEVKTLSKINTTYDYNTQLIHKISSPDKSIEVNFNYITDTGLPDSVWKTKLSSIVVSDLIYGRIKKFVFTYERYNGDPRLKLKSVYEVGYDENNNEIEKPPYIFQYENSSLPEKDSHAQDFFGFFNNSSGVNSLVPEVENISPSNFQGYFDAHSRNRSFNASAVEMGVLTDISYPTGGETHFEYEPNAINDRYCGGLRVQILEDTDETGTYNRKVYQYNNLNGFNLKDNWNLTIKQEGATKSYHSSFVTLPGDIISGYKTGYFYEKVTINSFDGFKNYKEEIEYEVNPFAFYKFDYSLKTHKSYKGTQPLKLVEYINEKIGSSQSLTWNILGDMICYGVSPQPIKLGYKPTPRLVSYSGNYAFLPTQIATTEFLKSGSIYKPVTTVQYMDYDEQTLLKTQEITDYRRTRNAYDNYPIEDTDGERTTVDYTYPWSPGINLNLPAPLPVKIEVFSLQNNNNKLSGQDFEYDSTGNIKTTFKYNKGQGSNNSPLSYVDSNYEQETSFKFKEGKPTQVLSKVGVPTSYIWGYNHQYPVAKIEGKFRSSLPSSLVTNIETTTNESTLQNLLEQLREYPTLDDAMVTTYTHLPLAGVRTITDPKGDKITYHYDGFGRLKYVTDKQNKRLTENEYNYGQ